MLEIQKFAINNIYCAPNQDRQFSFKLIRVNKDSQPVKRVVNIYNVNKNLPDTQYSYHVFIVGNLNPNFLNLLTQDKEWFRDVWVNASEDMVNRNYILKVYNLDGVIYPRSHTFYSFIDENSLLIAIRFDLNLQNAFNVNSFEYLHVYSNSYFNTNDFNTLPNRIGIDYRYSYVMSNTDKVALQNTISQWSVSGGKTLVYVNGYYTDNVTLNIPDGSHVELVYDQSILSKEEFPISSLRTFQSTKDSKLKYLIFRNNIINRIQYYDDNEIYIKNTNVLVPKGLYFYQHKDYAVRNVTDKDYSLYTNFVNNQASTLSTIVGGSIQNKVIVLFTRISGLNRELVYSNLKLHELYKLPQNVELDVLCNNNYTLTELRAETLENSDYFKISSLTNISLLTKELCMSAIGYSGVTYYFANTPKQIVPNLNPVNVDVPYLYQYPSTVFEYDGNGKFINYYLTTGPNYITNNSNVKYLEFIYGQSPSDFGKYYAHNETFTLRHNEFKILSAYFNGVTRLTNWEDITNNQSKVSITNNQCTLNEDQNKLIKVVYLNEPNIYNLSLPIVDGILYFHLTIYEDRGTGLALHPIDVPYTNIEIFLNGYRLTYGLDFFINFPYVSITNKKYIDYTKVNQDIHIRMYGFTLDKTEINSLEIKGFVNNGVLCRNRYYDIRDDRVFSVFIDGKIYSRNNVIFAEEDNTIRINHPYNGLPYTVKEPFIAIKNVTGLDTIPYYTANIELNKKISNLFNIIFPEPTINEFNIISDHHYIYSPTVSKIINDLLDGNINSNLYTNPYNDSTIIDLLDSPPYKDIYKIDPIKFDMPNNLVEIHPHIGNTTINLNLFQYRFLTNVIRIITNNNPQKINISGYITVTT